MVHEDHNTLPLGKTYAQSNTQVCVFHDYDCEYKIEQRGILISFHSTYFPYYHMYIFLSKSVHAFLVPLKVLQERQ